MLDRFLKPRWQHPDAGERRRAVEALGADEAEALVAVATEDPVPALRRLALRRVTDMDLLARRGAEDEDAGVREQAGRRLRELLCGSAEDAPPLGDRLPRLEAATDAELIEAVAREGAESALRSAAVARITRVAVLRDVVLGDPDPELRLAVLERIDDEPLLERIAEHSRTGDKRVHHRAREMLDARREARERPVRVRHRRELICGAAEGLGANGHWVRDAGRLTEMEREWAALTVEAQGPDPELEPGFSAARDRFAAGLAAFEAAASAAMEARERLIREVQALAEVEAAPAPAPEQGAPDAAAGDAAAHAQEASAGSPAGETDTETAARAAAAGDAAAQAQETSAGPPAGEPGTETGEGAAAAGDAAAQAQETSAGPPAGEPGTETGEGAAAAVDAAAQAQETSAGPPAGEPGTETGEGAAAAGDAAAQAQETSAGPPAGEPATETAVRAATIPGADPAPGETEQPAAVVPVGPVDAAGSDAELASGETDSLAGSAAQDAAAGSIPAATVDSEADAAPHRERRPPDPLKRHSGDWQAAPPHPDPDAARALEERFEAACRAVQAAREARRGASRLEGLRAECEALLSGKRRLNERGLKRVEQRLREVVGEDGPAGGGDLARLAAKVEGQVARLRERLREQVTQRHALLDGLPERLDALAAAVEEGRSAEAATLNEAIDKDLQSLEAMDAPVDRLKPLRRRLKAVAPKVRTLRAWEQFGADQARERLCDEMEALAAAELPPPEIAAKVREARARWKELAPGNPGQSQKLWRRFNGAATKAYEPCQAWFAERAETRKANLHARAEMTAAVDALADAFEAEGFDEAGADWKTLAKQRRDLERHWREAGPVDRKAARSQEKRFRAAVARLDKHLDVERQRCLATRERLIAEVEALHGTGDLREATERCKALQRQWQVTVPGSRQQEQALWERFRGACDVLFEQLKQQQGERRAQGRAAIEVREALCAQLETLLAVDDEGLRAARGEVERLRGEWRGAPRAPRRETEALDKRFEGLRRRFSARLEEARHAAARAALEALRARAALCGEAEALAAGGPASGEALQALGERWASAPPAGDGAEAVAARFERALAAAAQDDARAALAAGYGANRDAREGLCLRMEIVAGVDSPPQFAQARMQAQVARLASAFGDRKGAGRGDVVDTSTDSGDALLGRWCAAGPAAPADAPALEARFAAAFDAWSRARSS